MDNSLRRRKFIKTLLTVPVITSAGTSLFAETGYPENEIKNIATGKLRVSLNAFSFNEPLRNGSMSMDDLLEFSAASGFEAVDITAYYFPGYPDVPADEYLFQFRRKAFRLGLEISGTGVRNDFTNPEESKRKEDVLLVKRWIEAASKIGAPVIRIFAGNQNPPAGYNREQVIEWMLKDIRECVDYGRKRGVMVAIQNHNDFIQTADHAIEIINAINSDWFGLVLDTGSYRVGDPYQEIVKTINYAVNWQIKENVFVNGKEEETNLQKLVAIIKASDYRGYLPIETLGPGDPKEKVLALQRKLDKALTG